MDIEKELARVNPSYYEKLKLWCGTKMIRGKRKVVYGKTKEEVIDKLRNWLESLEKLKKCSINEYDLMINWLQDNKFIINLMVDRDIKSAFGGDMVSEIISCIHFRKIYHRTLNSYARVTNSKHFSPEFREFLETIFGKETTWKMIEDFKTYIGR